MHHVAEFWRWLYLPVHRVCLLQFVFTLHWLILLYFDLLFVICLCSVFSMFMRWVCLFLFEFLISFHLRYRSTVGKCIQETPFRVGVISVSFDD